MIGYYPTSEGIPKYINVLKDAQCKLACTKMVDVQLLAMASTAILASDHFPCTTNVGGGATTSLKNLDGMEDNIPRGPHCTQPPTTCIQGL